MWPHPGQILWQERSLSPCLWLPLSDWGQTLEWGTVSPRQFSTRGTRERKWVFRDGRVGGWKGTAWEAPGTFPYAWHKGKKKFRNMKPYQIRILSKLFSSHRNSKWLFQLSIFFRSVVFSIGSKTSSLKLSLNWLCQWLLPWLLDNTAEFLFLVVKNVSSQLSARIIEFYTIY